MADNIIIIENKAKGSVSGVESVIEFDEKVIYLKLMDGKLKICGDNLVVVSFDTEKGNFAFTGVIKKVDFENSATPFVKRIFK